MTEILIALISVLGGGVAAYVLELSRRRFDKNRAAKKLIQKYRDPLLHAAFELQSRLYNIVYKSFLAFTKSGTSDEKAYVKDSTLWHFAQYLGWTEVLRREVQFLELGTVSRNKELQKRLGAIASALASDSATYRPVYADAAEGDYRSKNEPPRFIVFRTDQRAIGEVMVTERALPEEMATSGCLGYIDFADKLRIARESRVPRTDPFSRWCRRFDADLEELAQGRWNIKHPRLIEIQRRLIDLIDILDPKYERFPNRDTRGKLPRNAGASSKLRYPLARFIDDRDPRDIAEDWAGQHNMRTSASAEATLYHPKRSWTLGVTLVAQVSQERLARWISIEGWARQPAWLRKPNGLIQHGLRGSGAGDEGQKLPRSSDWGNLPLDDNGLFFWNSRRRARNVANDLLHRFDRPVVLADPIPRRQWLIVAAGLVSVLLIVLLGWPGWIR